MSQAKTAASAIDNGTATSRQASTTRVSLSLNIRFLEPDGMLNSPGEAPNNNLEPDEPTTRSGYATGAGISRHDGRCKMDAKASVPD